MGKTIKMIVVVNGEEMTVGRCHPGQARILRKHGMAEWSKDKLVLGGASFSIQDGGVSIEGSFEEVFGSLEEVSEKLVRDGWEPETWAHRFVPGKILLEIMKEIDEEGLVSLDSQTYRFDGETVDCDSLEEWVLALRDAQEKGHDLYGSDDPRTMKLGFTDDTTNTWYSLAIRHVKKAGPEVYEKLGLEKGCLGTQEGRLKLINPNGSDFTFNDLDIRPEDWHLNAEADPELRKLWMQDARADIEEFERDGNVDLVPVLGLLHPHEIPRPGRWHVDAVRSQCGLLPQEEFIAKNQAVLEEHRKRSPYFEEGRQTGKTTEVVLQAVAAALNGEVVTLKGETRDQTEAMLTLARKLASKCDRSWATRFSPYREGQPGEWKVFREDPTG